MSSLYDLFSPRSAEGGGGRSQSQLQVECKVRDESLLFHLLLEGFNLGRRTRNLHLNLIQSVN